MVTPKRVAYHGRLSKSVTKAVLVISVAGYLSFGGGTAHAQDTHDGFAKKEVSSERVSKKRIAQDDDEVMLIIKAFLECQ